jgi:hypothetical protein
LLFSFSFFFLLSHRYKTAGRRPKQPPQEREYFEKIWSANFENSSIPYSSSSSSASIAVSPSHAKISSLHLSERHLFPEGNNNTSQCNINSDHNCPSSLSSEQQQKLQQQERSHLQSKTSPINPPLTFDSTASASVRSISSSSAFIPSPPQPSNHLHHHSDVIPTSEIQGEILYRGKSPFSNAVSKSFFNETITSITLQMPYYRVIRGLNSSKNQGIFAEFLIKITLCGGYGAVVPLTFGIWKRHSDFTALASLIETLHNNSSSWSGDHSYSSEEKSSSTVSRSKGERTSSTKEGPFKNALLSWQCLLQRKRWFRSLDKDYLSLKCFLLERFMHDLLFESTSSTIISKFLGLEL